MVVGRRAIEARLGSAAGRHVRGPVGQSELGRCLSRSARCESCGCSLEAPKRFSLEPDEARLLSSIQPWCEVFKGRIRVVSTNPAASNTASTWTGVS